MGQSSYGRGVYGVSEMRKIDSYLTS